MLAAGDPTAATSTCLVVVDRPLTLTEKSLAGERLVRGGLALPGRGPGAQRGDAGRRSRGRTSRPPFELHVTTAPQDRKVVDGHGHPGDRDLVLHFAVCSFARLHDGLRRGALAPLVLTQLADELTWAADHAPSEYAVLNACRAWRYAVDGVARLEARRRPLGRARGSATPS